MAMSEMDYMSGGGGNFYMQYFENALSSPITLSFIPKKIMVSSLYGNSYILSDVYDADESTTNVWEYFSRDNSHTQIPISNSSFSLNGNEITIISNCTKVTVLACG